MPFYTYRCPRSGAEAEEMRPLDDRNVERPLCENGDVPMVMDLVIAPVPGIVRNPAVPKRQK